MSIYRGSEGLVKIGTKTIAEVNNWTIEQSVDTTDASVMGDHWQRHVALLKSWTGSATAFWDEDDTQGQGALLLGKAFTLRFYPSSNSRYFTGTVLVTGLSLSAGMTDLVEASFSFQGTGELKIMAPGKKTS